MTLTEAMAIVGQRETAQQQQAEALADPRIKAARAAGLPDNPDLNKLTPQQNILFGLKLSRSARSQAR